MHETWTVVVHYEKAVGFVMEAIRSTSRLCCAVKDYGPMSNPMKSFIFRFHNLPNEFVGRFSTLGYAQVKELKLDRESLSQRNGFLGFSESSFPSICPKESNDDQ